MKKLKFHFSVIAVVSLTIISCAFRDNADAQDEKLPITQLRANQEAAVSDADIKQLQDKLLQKGIYFGTALTPADIESRPPRPANFPELVSKYFNFYTITVTYNLTESRARGQFTLTDGDRCVDFALAHHAKIKMHVLVLGDPIPDWLKNGNYNPEQLKDILKTHVQTIIRHFKTKYPKVKFIYNVVNEPTCNGGKVTDPLKCLDYGVEKNIWTVIHKPDSTDPTDYIQLAFEWAREADPTAKLYLNEAGGELDTHPKTERVYQLVKYLKEKGTPIDGIGLQGHVRLYDKTKYSQEGLTRLLNRYADLGLETQISEFDVVMASGNKRIDTNTPTVQLAMAGPRREDFMQQAELYRIFLAACLHAKNCTGFTTWGLWDGSSWTTRHWSGAFYPHLLDDNLKPKLSFKALVDEASSQQ